MADDSDDEVNISWHRLRSRRDSNTEQQGSTGLLDLPPEIWSKICKLAVSHDFTIDVFLCYEHHNRRKKAIVDWCATGYDCIEVSKFLRRIVPPRFGALPRLNSS